jgi:SAM-dependent methyltransferase
MTVDSTQRFTTRVDAYARFRPGYPDALVAALSREIGLTSDWQIADVGAGTGLSAMPFLENGNTVYGVEPNAAMRTAAAERLADQPRFFPVDGTAEATGLPAHSVDLILAAQAFHWFEPELARNEFARILRGPGWVTLAWNTRSTTATPFLREYEELLLRYGTDYSAVRHDRLDDARLHTLYSAGYQRHVLPNRQVLDREGIRGRLISSSYVPGAGQPHHEEMLAELDRVFDRHNQNGTVTLLYELEVFTGRVPPSA